MKIDTDKYLSTAEFAELVGAKNADMIKKYCQRKVIHAVNQFNRWMIPTTEVDRYLNEQRKPGPKPRA